MTATTDLIPGTGRYHASTMTALPSLSLRHRLLCRWCHSLHHPTPWDFRFRLLLCRDFHRPRFLLKWLLTSWAWTNSPVVLYRRRRRRSSSNLSRQCITTNSDAEMVSIGVVEEADMAVGATEDSTSNIPCLLGRCWLAIQGVQGTWQWRCFWIL